MKRFLFALISIVLFLGVLQTVIAFPTTETFASYMRQKNNVVNVDTISMKESFVAFKLANPLAEYNNREIIPNMRLAKINPETSLVLTILFVLVLVNSYKAYRVFSPWKYSIFGLFYIGIVISIILCIIYFNFNSAFVNLVQSNVYLQHLVSQNPSLFVYCLSGMMLIFAIPLNVFIMRMNSLGITYTKLILNHNYEKAIEVSKQRIRLANKFCGGGFIAKASLVSIAFLYTNIGKKEEVEELFKSSEGILNKYTSLKERVSMWLQKSEYYLFVEDTTNAEIYCQKVLDCGENRKAAKSPDIFLSRALLQKALIQGLKGNYQAFISESSTAKKAFQNLIGKRFRGNWGKKLILALSVKQILFPFIIMLPLLALIFPILRTREFAVFIVAFFVVSDIIIEPFLEKIIKSNDDIMQSIREYFLLIQKEGKFYEYLGDYDLARERYSEALQGLSTFYQDLSTSLNKEYTITKELILARSFVYLGSLTITISSQKTVSLDDKLSYYSNAISDYDKALAIYNSVNLNAENLIHQDYRADVITCLIEKCLAYVKLVGISVAEAEVLQTFPSIENLLIYPTHYTQYAGGLIELGSLYYCDHNYSRAEEYYSKAEQILKQYLGSSNENILWRSRLDFAWASLYIMTQRLDKALMRLKQSNKTSATILLQLLSVASDKHRMYALQLID